MEYIGSCASISSEEWDRLMKGTKPCSGRLLRKQIERENPEIAEALCLRFTNPFEGQCRRNPKTSIAVYVHSAIEHFFKY